MNSLTVYSRKAKDYDLFRPDYADGAVQKMIDMTGLDAHWTVADIGSGTGNVSKHLLDHVNTLYAVEPNRAMRKRAEFLLNHHESFKSVDATAEKTSLDKRSIDMITVGQAIHWFNHDLARVEFFRIIKPGGWLAIIWNEFGRDQHLNVGSFFIRSDYKMYSYPQTIFETWDAYMGGVRTLAAAPNPEDSEYNAFEKAHRRIFNSRATDGIIKVNFITRLILGQMDC